MDTTHNELNIFLFFLEIGKREQGLTNKKKINDFKFQFI